MAATAALAFDLFCRVVDNYGDIGVCWRLAAELAARHQTVRLWVDDASALAWMAPAGAAGVEVHAWDAAADAQPADVVVEAFGCDPPPAFVARMAAAARPPRWVNLEYLSAETWVERCHGLPSPQLGGPGRGLVKHFFYPGFTARTGGLLREADLPARQAAFDAAAWRRERGLAPVDGELLVSLFCYSNAPLPVLWQTLAGRRARVLLTPGAAQALVAAHPPPDGVRTERLPWLSQRDYDHLLWSCDLNFVRGEDSAVRAMWAGKPFIWQLYPQHDRAHEAKLDAFLDRLLEPGMAITDAADDAALRRIARAWNGFAAAGNDAWPDPRAWTRRCLGWRERLLAQTDLVTQLLAWIAAPRRP